MMSPRGRVTSQDPSLGVLPKPGTPPLPFAPKYVTPSPGFPQAKGNPEEASPESQARTKAAGSRGRGIAIMVCRAH